MIELNDAPACRRSGGMIRGRDSHTRRGPFGCMGIGRGGPEKLTLRLESLTEKDREILLRG